VISLTEFVFFDTWVEGDFDVVPIVVAHPVNKRRQMTVIIPKDCIFSMFFLFSNIIQFMIAWIPSLFLIHISGSIHPKFSGH